MPAGAKGLNVGGRRFCTHCGADCRDTDRFCAACCHTLSAAPAAWGEVKPATILFADIVDSTRQIAELSPEQAMRQLQPAVERMVAVVEQHGGYLGHTAREPRGTVFTFTLTACQYA